MQLFWRKGYGATSLQDLLSVTRLSKSSLYQTFGNKHRLFERSMEHYRRQMVREMEMMLEKAPSGLAFIEQLFLSVTGEARGRQARRGCLIMNTASEFAQRDPVVARLVKQATRAFRKVFEAAIVRAQAEGDIPVERDPAILAAYLVSSLSGLKTQVKAGATAEELKAVVMVVLSALR